MFVELILLVVTFYILIKWLKPSKPTNFPPGPDGYPIVGAVPLLASLDSNPAAALEKLGDKYGPICGLRLFQQWSVVVNGYEAVNEVLSNDEFVERPDLFLVTSVWGGRRMGIFFGQGEVWKEQRRFTMRNLRDFGFGKSSLEGLIHEEVDDCLKFIKKNVQDAKDSVISIEDLFGIPVLNIMWAVASGNRISRDDEKMMVVLNKLRAAFRAGSPLGMLINDFPFLRHLPVISKDFHEIIKGIKSVHSVLYKEIAEHQKDRDETASRDFMDVYLKEMEEEKKRGKTNSTFSVDQLVSVVSDLFSAGAESTSNTVAFALLHMIMNPHVQEKVHEELDRVVGKDRLPSVNDRPNLNYTEAVLTEVLRHSSIAPVFPQHYNEKPAKLFGYNIPKQSFVFVNIQSVHMDQKYWGDPQNFRPERFLDADGKFVKNERILTFGRGKRMCVGEPMARMTFYSFFTATMQNFKLEAVPGKSKLTTDPVVGFTVAPKPFEAKITCRC